MNISVSSRDVEHEAAVMETLRKHLWRDKVYKFADFVKVQAKETII